METAIYRPSSWPYTIHVLGNGPYAKEVVRQTTHPVGTEFHFVSSGDDKSSLPAMLMVGIASPTIKMAVIEKFYCELEYEAFCSSVSSMTVIADDTWRTIRLARCVNIGPFTSIGHNTKIDDFVSNCANLTIGHDCTIGKYSTICPGAVVSGNVCIEKGVFVGAGAIVMDSVTISEGAAIGCGAVVIEDVMKDSIVAGNPARHLKFREKAECSPT